MKTSARKIISSTFDLFSDLYLKGIGKILLSLSRKKIKKIVEKVDSEFAFFFR